MALTAPTSWQRAIVRDTREAGSLRPPWMRGGCVVEIRLDQHDYGGGGPYVEVRELGGTKVWSAWYPCRFQVITCAQREEGEGEE